MDTDSINNINNHAIASGSAASSLNVSNNNDTEYSNDTVGMSRSTTFNKHLCILDIDMPSEISQANVTILEGHTSEVHAQYY